VPQLRFQPNRLTAILSTTLLISVVLVAIPCGSKKGRSAGESPGGPDPVTQEELPPPTEIGYGLEGADPDSSWHPATSAPALTLPGLGEFVFEHAGRLTEFEHGSATIHGQLRSTSLPGAGFRLELTLAERVDPGQPSVLADPVLELDADAYAEHGGPVDPGSWTLFDSASGRLIGVGDHRGGEYELRLEETPAHLGEGASGRNADNGIGARLEAILRSPATTGPNLPEHVDGATLTLSVLETLRSCVDAPLVGGLELSGWDARFFPVARGSFVEDAAGFGTLTQTLVEHGTADRGFELSVEFFDPVSFGNPDHPPAGSPLLHLPAPSYVVAGGAVEPAHWRYYREARGTAHGLGLYAGVEIQLETGPAAAQIGHGAHGTSLEHGAFAALTVSSFSEVVPGTLPSSPGSQATLELLLQRPCAECTFGGCASFAHTPTADTQALLPGGVALSLRGIADDLVVAGGSSWVEDPLGRVQATGLLASASQPFLRFAFELHLGGRLEPGSPENAAISLPRELSPGAYTEAGGPVDPSTWTLFTEVDLVLRGIGGAAGASLLLSLDSDAGAQGDGASGRSVASGFFAPLAGTLEAQPRSGAPWPTTLAGSWVALDLAQELSSCALGSLPDPATGLTRSRSAVTLVGIGAAFEFEQGTQLVEGHDGRARLVGTLVDSNNDDRRFTAEFELGGRVDPGVLGHPAPPGAQELLPSWYHTAEGGPIDSSTWSYYRELSATLHGQQALEGALLVLEREGPAVQVGVGANGENTAYGLRGTFSVEFRSWPGSFPGGAGAGTIQLELPVTCP